MVFNLSIFFMQTESDFVKNHNGYSKYLILLWAKKDTIVTIITMKSDF